jgi:hypothetical protein
MKRAATIVGVLAACALAVFAVVRGTWSVGGSDSSCYGLMAAAFARGELQPATPLAAQAPWPDASRTFAPGGFIPSPITPFAAAPICVPGFSLLLAPFARLGTDGIFLFMPIAAALFVWVTFVTARQLGGPAAGALAALVLATTPIVLFQAVQPMNDVTTALLWMSVIAAAGLDTPRKWWMMGALTGLALLVRPNLAPAGLVVGAWVLVRARAAAPVLQLVAAATPAVVVLGALNWALYGSPLRVGYGSPADLFSVANVPANAARYSRTALETLTIFPLLALVAPFVVVRERRPVVWLSIGIIAATVAVYLVYRPFDEWWYLRFLLPAVAPAVALASAALVLLVRRPILIALAGVGLAIFGLTEAAERQVGDVARVEARFRHTGRAVRDRLPANAVFFTVWQSGTVRYHAERTAVLWDSLDPAYLDRAVEWVKAQGFEPYLLLERWEEPLFRERFAGRSRLGALDWPPRMEVDRLVRIYAPDDRAVYLAGQAITTEHVIER